MSDVMYNFLVNMWILRKVSEDDLEQLVNDKFLTIDEFDGILSIERKSLDE